MSEKLTDAEKRRECDALYRQLEEEREEWRLHWLEIQKFIVPRWGRWLDGDSEPLRERGKKKQQEIVRGIAKRAVRTFAAGIQGDLTSKARKWFRLSHPDKQVNELTECKRWLSVVTDRMYEVFARSNFYETVYRMYSELACFGTAVCMIEEDYNRVVRFRPLTIGEFYLATDPNGDCDILLRRFTMTSRQMTMRFGEDNVPDRVAKEVEERKGETEHTIIHIIRPNAAAVSGADNPLNYAYESLYYEDASRSRASTEATYREDDQHLFLEQRTYKSKPFAACRWEVTSDCAYGDSPAMDALPDIKQLQKMSADKLRAIAKAVNPPLNAPASMKGSPAITEGAINYMQEGNNQNWLTPTYQTNANIAPISQEIELICQEIQKWFYNDILLAITNQDKRMTATEVAERSSEKLMQVGSAIGRIENELLRVCIDRTYDKMEEMNLIPPVPQMLMNVDLKVEYIGILTQAQKAKGIAATEQVAGFIGNLAAVKPEIVDKLDFDQAVDEYADDVGVSPNIIRSDDEVEEIRAKRAQEQQQAAQMQQMVAEAQAAQNVASGAKTLSETDVGGNNALEALIGGAAGGEQEIF